MGVLRGAPVGFDGARPGRSRRPSVASAAPNSSARGHPPGPIVHTPSVLSACERCGERCVAAELELDIAGRSCCRRCRAYFAVARADQALTEAGAVRICGRCQQPTLRPDAATYVARRADEVAWLASARCVQIRPLDGRRS